MSTPLTHSLTILLTDIKGFTDKTSRKSRSDIEEMLEQHKQIVLPVLESRGGRLIKTIGDAFLMVFESPTDAVLAGTAVQDALLEYNAGKTGDDRIEIRIAINLGEVNLKDNDIFGEPVNITARIEGIADAGEVFFTEAVYLAMNKSEVPSSEVGLLQLKGIPEKIRVYKVRRENPIGGSANPIPNAAGRFWNIIRPKAEQGMEPAPKASLAQPLANSPIWRRALALAFDALICSMLVSILLSSDKGLIKVSHNHVNRLKAGMTSEIGTAKDGKVMVNLDEDGIRVNAGKVKVSIGEKGINVDGAQARAEKGGGSDAAGEQEVLYDKGRLKVTNKPNRRKSLFPFFWLVYSTLFLGLWNATPGKHMFKLSVTQQDGSKIEWKHAFTRSLISLISFGALFLGYLWALWEKDHRGWHDLLAGTRVSLRTRD